MLLWKDKFGFCYQIYLQILQQIIYSFNKKLSLSPFQLCLVSSKLPSDWLTPHIVFVCAIQLFDPSVAEGQFPHPVDPAADTSSQAQVGAGRSCMEAISCKTVSTVDNNDMFYLKNLHLQNRNVVIRIYIRYYKHNCIEISN